MEESYCSRDVEAYTIGNGQVMVYIKGQDIISPMPQAILKLLLFCDRFQPLEKHLQRFADQFHLPQKQKQVLRDSLKELVKGEFLISKQDFINRCAEHPAAKASPITSLGILTRNRPALLERCLRSFAENAVAFGRRIDLVVVDNSDDEAIRRGNRLLLSTLQKEFQQAFFYAGVEEKMAYSKQLAQASLLPEDIIEFALLDPLSLGYAPGCNRNALLFDHVGRMFVTADDDVVAQTANVPSASAGLRFFSGNDPMDYWVYRDYDELAQSIPLVETDVIALHEKLLGRSLSGVVAQQQPGALDCDGLESRLLGRLETGEGHIAITLPGLIGGGRSVFRQLREQKVDYPTNEQSTSETRTF